MSSTKSSTRRLVEQKIWAIQSSLHPDSGHLSRCPKNVLIGTFLAYLVGYTNLKFLMSSLTTMSVESKKSYIVCTQQCLLNGRQFKSIGVGFTGMRRGDVRECTQGCTHWAPPKAIFKLLVLARESPLQCQAPKMYEHSRILPRWRYIRIYLVLNTLEYKAHQATTSYLYVCGSI